MAKSKHITVKDIEYLANLSKLPLTATREKALVPQVETVFEYADTLAKVDTEKVSETNQVTGLTNVWRKDEVDLDRMLPQKDALKNAKATHKGYFMVPHILE